MKKNSLKNMIIVIVFWVIALTTVAYTVYYQSMLVDDKSTAYAIEVGDKMVFRNNKSMVNFGGLPAGASSEKIITLENKHPMPLKVEIKAKGAASGWVSSSINGFVIDVNQSRDITLRASVPNSAKYGNYTGIIEILMKKS